MLVRAFLVFLFGLSSLSAKKIDPTSASEILFTIQWGMCGGFCNLELSINQKESVYTAFNPNSGVKVSKTYPTTKARWDFLMRESRYVEFETLKPSYGNPGAVDEGVNGIFWHVGDVDYGTRISDMYPSEEGFQKGLKVPLSTKMVLNLRSSLKKFLKQVREEQQAHKDPFTD